MCSSDLHDYVLNSANDLLHNFCRYDDLLHRERRAHKFTTYNMFFWNDDTPRVLNRVREALTRFSNTIGGRPVEGRLGYDGDKVGGVVGAHYPPGGCLLSHHFADDTDDVFEKFDEMIVQFDKYGVDYHQGGLYAGWRYRLGIADDPSNHAELHFLEHDLDPGDLLAFTIKDVYHRVEPVDPDLEDPHDPMKGRFILAFYYARLSDYRHLAAHAGKDKKTAPSFPPGPQAQKGHKVPR